MLSFHAAEGAADGKVDDKARSDKSQADGKGDNKIRSDKEQSKTGCGSQPDSETADGKVGDKVRSDKAQTETGCGSQPDSNKAQAGDKGNPVTEGRKLFKKADALLISVILLFLLLFPLLKSEGGSAVAHVYLRDKEIACIELDKVKSPVTIRPNTKPKVEIRAEKGFIYYSYAECPDKLCVKAGKLSKPGSTAACLPSKTLIVIEGKRPRNAPDVITY